MLRAWIEEGDGDAEDGPAGSLGIRWRGADPAARALAIYRLDTPNAAPAGEPVVRIAAEEGRARVPVEAAPRHVFWLAPDRGAGCRVASRALGLPGSRNLRDLGGYAGHHPSAGSRPLRWGRLLRSGHFSDLSPEARAALPALGVDRVIDFRIDVERERRPNGFRGPGAPVEIRVEIHPGSGAHFGDMLRGEGADEGAVVAVMCELNRHLVRDHQTAYRRVFELLLEDETPGATVLHCASGKDRTGLAAALVLLALGVDREEVLADYLLTNRHLDPEREVARALDDFGAFRGEGLDPALLRPLYEVRAAYLEAALDEIDRGGGLEAFLADALGLVPSRRERLAERYLEAPG